MIIRDSQLTTKEEIQLRINSIQKQLDKEIYSSTRSNAISAKIKKDEKIRKLNERMGILRTKLKTLKAL